MIADVRHGIYPAFQQRRDCGDGAVQGIDVDQLVPGHRRRHRRRRGAPRRISGGHRAVAGVLIEVDEEPLSALFFPPRGGDRRTVAAFELTRQGDHRTPGLDEIPARLDGHEHVQTASARGLGETDKTQFVEQWPQHVDGNTARVGEVRARLRIEVDPELVGMVVVRGDRGPRMKCDSPQIGRPHDDRRAGGPDGVGLAAGGKGDRRRLHEVGAFGRHALLVDLFTFDAVGETLQEGRSVAQGRQHRALQRHGAVVLHQIPFPAALLAELGEVDLVGVGQPHRGPVDIEFFGRSFRHQSCPSRTSKRS